MEFETFVDEVFIDHHDGCGFDFDEIEEMLEQSTWEQRRSWLIRNGYNLSNMFYAAFEIKLYRR